jgi:hypothetical protein
MGILHAFILLRPLLKRAFQTEQALNHLQNSQMQVDRLPILTSKNCS